VEKGGKLVQETRGWVAEKEITVTQRSKEYADDYRYFPEPDLPPLVFDRKWIEEVKTKLPELPEARRDRFISQYGLPLYDANILTSSKGVADYFEKCLKLADHSKAKSISNWLLGDFSRLLNASNIEIEDTKVSPEHLAELLNLVDSGTLSGPASKTVFEEMFYSGKKASDIIAAKKLSQISDAATIKEAVRQVIASNEKAVSDYYAGKQPALTFLTGQVMKATRGRANPKLVREILIQDLRAGSQETRG
jgi:aspartyl-tRNA(Asn)/glutamyl-tRNA(Gln) amidotransferase subunit B